METVSEKRVDYVIFNTSYTDRIVEDPSLLEKLIKIINKAECRLVFIKQYNEFTLSFNKEGQKIKKSEETKRIVEVVETEKFPIIAGICVAVQPTTQSIVHVLQIHIKLEKLDFCANLSGLYETEQKGNILIMKYDTESG